VSGYLAIGVILLTGFSMLRSEVSWAYLAFLAGYEIWLLRRLRGVGAGPVPVDEAPYRFTAEEAAFIERYRFYFTYPAMAKEASGVLSALGITALLLVPWFIYKAELVQAALIGANLFVIARMTKDLAPVLALRIRANKGDRAALRLLELHDPLWQKIREAVL
jgi:pimeloyl-ACP methyl ester carboxylesterase